MSKKTVFINPNSTDSITQACANTLKTLDGLSEQDFSFVTNASGPAAIQGEEDGQQALAGLFELIAVNLDQKAIIIGCFDDIGLFQAREKFNIPVMGLGQAAYLNALVHRDKFIVLTTLVVSVPVIWQSITQLGFRDCCLHIQASGIPVLDLDKHPVRSISTIGKYIKKLNQEYPNIPIVLGCAGMTRLLSPLQKANKETILIDPVRSALNLSTIL